MKNRNLGKSGIKASEIGLGTWQLGGDFGSLDEETGLNILRAAADAGITFFDTADVYGGGRSEQIIGQYLKETDKDITVVTKYGRDGSVYPDTYNEKTLRHCVEASLDRLGVSSLDLLQLHCIPQPVLEQGSIFPLLEKIKGEGLIRNFGASVETMEEAHICMKQEGLASLQIIFNIFRQDPIDKIFDEALEKNVGIIVRLPLASGLLAGKYTKETTFEAQDHRNYNADGKAFSVGETFSGIPFEKGIELVEELRPLVPEGMTMAQFALRWILDHPAVSTIIAGASKLYQVESNRAAAEFPALSDELHSTLKDFYYDRVESLIRGRF